MNVQENIINWIEYYMSCFGDQFIFDKNIASICYRK